jgi:glycogen debranching enzyme
VSGLPGNGGETPSAGARVLKRGETFGVFDARGDVVPLAHGEHGLFHGGTRHLCRLLLRVGRQRPTLLGSTIRQDNASLEVDLANPELRFRGGVAPQETVHLWRSRLLEEGRSGERLRIRNFGRQGVRLVLTLAFAADFADLFEVRGVERRRRGRLLAPAVETDAVLLAYEGLDGILRRTLLRFQPAPDLLRGGAAIWRLELGPGVDRELELEILCLQGAGEPPARRSYALARDRATLHWRRLEQRWCRVHSDLQDFDEWLDRSRLDLGMLETETPHGPYMYAGVPWFSTPFGRDALITGLATCWARPGLTAGVLRYLAATQARHEDPMLDAEPGKILHEARGGRWRPWGRSPSAATTAALTPRPCS